MTTPNHDADLEVLFEHALSLREDALEDFLNAIPRDRGNELRILLGANAAADSYFKDAFMQLHPEGSETGIPESDLEGERIAHFEILHELGRGGMSRVYVARDTRLGRDVALKVVRLSEVQNYKEFIRESRAVASLDHKNICGIYSTGFTDDDSGYIEMPLYQGSSVRELMNAAQLSAATVSSIVRQCACGLDASHSAGIIHRDIKPDNLFMEEDGTLRILDFGVARLEARIMTTAAGILKGTVSYMSPERFTNPPGGTEIDIWALGVTAYELTTGLKPFQGKSIAEVMASILNDELSGTSEMPQPLRFVIENCLRKDPKERFSGANEIESALDAGTNESEGFFSRIKGRFKS